MAARPRRLQQGRVDVGDLETVREHRGRVVGTRAAVELARRRVVAAAAADQAAQTAQERAGAPDALLLGVDDRLLAVVVRVVVGVRVARDLGLDVVQDDAPDLAADVLDVHLRPLEDQPSDLPGLVDEHDAVDLGADDRGVRHRQDRRRVDQHHVVLVAHLAQELAHRRGR